MSIVLYYHKPDPGGVDLFPTAEYFGDTELGPALARTEQVRQLGFTHVCISTEDPNSVGKPGVASVEGGKTPDGEPYDWRKRRV
jgi:hypothetical protein